MADGVKFNAGDVVQLKAGGPKMVVEKWLDGPEVYKCTWFAGAKHNSERFTEEALQIFVEDSK
ncbi:MULTISPECIES: YodC family protein [Acetobacter]|uniref:YodC family protein n=1 Tax=Acetobacter TaxID=434 RepID=UPI0039E8963B